LWVRTARYFLMFVHHVVGRARGFSHATSGLRVQSDEIDSVPKEIRSPHTIREEKLHDGSEDCLLLFGPRNCLDADLPAFEKLDEADALDVLRGEAFVRIGADEFE
jgi:hypothetical protein